MDALFEATQDVVIAEQETATQPDPVQPDDGAVETQLTNQINTLWSDHLRLSADRRTTAVELRQIRAILAERLYEMKAGCASPDVEVKWCSWLKERGHQPEHCRSPLRPPWRDVLGMENGVAPSEAISEPAEDSADKLAKSVWQRFGKLLTNDDAVIQFIGSIATAWHLHEWRKKVY